MNGTNLTSQADPERIGDYVPPVFTSGEDIVHA